MRSYVALNLLHRNAQGLGTATRRFTLSTRDRRVFPQQWAQWGAKIREENRGRDSEPSGCVVGVYRGFAKTGV